MAGPVCLSFRPDSTTIPEEVPVRCPRMTALMLSAALPAAGCASGPRAIGIEFNQTAKRMTFKGVRVNNPSETISFHKMVLEITGNVGIPLADDAGVRIDPFRLELPLEGALE